MSDGGRNRLSLAFAREIARLPGGRLCRASADAVGVSGAGITLMTSSGGGGPVCVSNARMSALEDLQFTLGEGPCQDAFASGASVHAARLDRVASARWPAFVDLARSSGVGSVFAYPMVSSRSKVGVLTLYQDAEGELSAGQHEDSKDLAEVLTETVLSLQADAPTDALAFGLEAAIGYRAEVHQAAGMVSIQLDVPVAEAMVRLRAHAYATDRQVVAVAKDIVARRLRLSIDLPERRED
ncbi:MAG: GAF and ANTAR domain-containing protein [Ilumatobacteraceae bacterium]